MLSTHEFLEKCEYFGLNVRPWSDFIKSDAGRSPSWDEHMQSEEEDSVGTNTIGQSNSIPIGIPTNDTPANGPPANGPPANGPPANPTPANGIPIGKTAGSILNEIGQKNSVVVEHSCKEIGTGIDKEFEHTIILECYNATFKARSKKAAKNGAAEKLVQMLPANYRR